MSKLTIGVDVSKDRLDVHCLPEGNRRQFANDEKGHAALCAWLKDQEIERIVYEATGAYHHAFERNLWPAGLPLARVNPLHARRFAQASGKLAKTDKADAAMLAEMGMALAPRLLIVPSQVLDNVREVYGAREALIKDRTALRNRLEGARLPLIKKQINQRLKQIEKHIEALDDDIHDRCRQDPHIKHRLDILTSIPGIGPITAWAMLIDMPELGTLNTRTSAALAGLAPVTRQSGTWRGKTMIQGGRARLRRALYMPALVACRHNPMLKEFYTKLIKRGKPAKVAITAVMRKLITIANALIRDNRKWT